MTNFAVVPSLPVDTQQILDPLERFLGSDAIVLQGDALAISNNILVEWVRVALPSDTVAEDEGKLYLFPIGDGEFCLQLCFLQYDDDASDNGTVCAIRFMPAFFGQYPAEMLMSNKPFRFDEVTEQQFPVTMQMRTLLSQCDKNVGLASFARTLQQTELCLQLLRSALEGLTVPITDSQVPACRFLAFETERDKISEARNIIEQHLDRPHTIRELSRKVAMNECYLKKGFKALTGKTIHEYQQELRIARAKELLQGQGLSVTDVANTLGYSSISHFSTAFKRVTGIKPCELLS